MSGKVNLDDLRRLRDEGLAAGAGSSRWIKGAQALMDAFPAFYATAKTMNAEAEARSIALRMCVDVLLRMIPDYLAEHPAQSQCSDTEHDAALACAAQVLYGPDQARWPLGLRKAVTGQYE